MRFLFLLYFLFIVASIKGQDYSRKELNYVPKNLNEAIEQLQVVLQDSTKENILTMTEEDFVARSHFGLGMWIRNNWGLWKEKELADYFNSLGIFHPDDMSGIILTSYYRELQGQDWRVNEQVEYYQEYWQKSIEHNQKLETDTSYQRLVHEQQDPILKARFEEKKLEWVTGTRVSGYVDYRCGLLDGLYLRTEIEGTIIGWENEIMILFIDRYLEEKKKKGVIKCNGVKNDTAYIANHQFFHIIEE